MAKTPQEMEAAMVANYKEKTGKTLEQWLAIAKKTGAAKHGQVVKALKTDHGLTHGYANLVAHKMLQSDAGSQAAEGTDLVAAQYAGPKAGLKPIYDAVIKAASSLGKDVEIAPKKTYVSLRRNKQFAIVQPSTRTRVDLGINLSGFSDLGVVIGAELVMSTLVVVVLLSSISQQRSNGSMAAFTGAAYALGTLFLLGISGAGMNPARSIGAAVFADTDPNALGQVWVFVLVPIVAAMAGMLAWLAIDDATIDDTIFDDTILEDLADAITGDD